MTVGSGRLPSMNPDAKSLGIPDLQKVFLVSVSYKRGIRGFA
jgi:hypothetical protein